MIKDASVNIRMMRAAAFAAALLFLPTLAGAETLLRRGNGAEPQSLDIHGVQGVPEAHLLRDLYEGLVAEAADGAHIPGAAESWTIGADGTVYTFRLRPDGKWSNGDTVKASDFVFAFRRGMNPMTASPYAFLMYPVKNARAITTGERLPETLGIRAIDGLTLEITLEQPTPYFLGQLTHYFAYPLHAASVAGAERGWTRPGNLVTNGAYLLAEWVPQSHITLTKNPHFHDAKNVSIKAIRFVPTEDASSELKRYRAGELDMTATVPLESYQWAEENLPDELRRSPALGIYYYALNTTLPKFADPRVRQALAMGIHREVITEKITRAGETPAYGWVPPGTLGYTNPARTAWSEMGVGERVQEAKRLMTAAGYGPDKPLEVELLYNTSEGHKKLAIAVAAMWKALGVRVTLRNEEWKVYLASRNQGDFEVSRAGWIGDYNDPYTFLEILRGDAGLINATGYANAEYDSLLDQSGKELDPVHRAKLMAAAEQLLLDDLPVLPVYFYVSRALVKPNVAGWEPNVMGVHPSRWMALSGR
jgi:oligopeptide transport system substrate-binding protein